MEYISTKDAAKKWGISLRRVQQLIADGRITGAKKYGVSWMIPASSEKPNDPRKVHKTRSKKEPEYLFMTSAVFSKRNHSVIKYSNSLRYMLNLEADMAYRRGDPQPAIDLWRNTAVDDPIKLTAASIATVAAISIGDFVLYDEIQKTLQSIMVKTKNKRSLALLSLPQTLAAVSMASVGMTPQWLMDGDFSLFDRELIPFLMYLYALHLRNIGELKGVLYTAKTSYELCVQTNTFTWIDIYNLILCAQASFDLGDRTKAQEYLLSAMKLGLPIGFIAPFADYLGTLGGLVENCLDTYFPEQKEPIIELWSQYFNNWMVFHNRFTRENITTVLKSQEYQLARMIAHGTSYVEAARQMNLSVGRVKNILHDVYSKLYISKKSQLNLFLT